MGCEDPACADARDSIKVVVNPNTDNIQDTVDYSNIGFMKRWIKRSFQFTVTNPEIEVLSKD